MDDILENIEKFENRHILFVHLSQKYRAQGIALKILRQFLPQEILSKVYVSLKCFGHKYDVTKVETVQWEKREREVGTGWGIPSKKGMFKHNKNSNRTDNNNIRKGKFEQYQKIENDK